MNIADHLKKIDVDGYTIIENVIPRALCQTLGSLLDDIYDKRGGDAFSYPGCSNAEERLIISPHLSDDIFLQLIDHPTIVPIIESLLEENFILNYFNARDTRPHCPPQGIHIDSRIPIANDTLVAQAIWMIDDFTAGNGATRVVPGSHRSGLRPDKQKTYPGEVQLTGKAGSLLIYNSCLWHAGSACPDYTRRWAIINTFSRWFVKPSIDFVRGMPSDLYARLNPKQKQIFGFNSVPPINVGARVATVTPMSSLPEKLEDYRIT